MREGKRGEKKGGGSTPLIHGTPFRVGKTEKKGERKEGKR